MISYFLLFLLLLFVAGAAANTCFADDYELTAAVNEYIAGGCGNLISICNVTQTYGWPIGTWCVGNVTDMSNLFYNRETFNEDLSGWDVSRVTTMRSMFSSALAFNGDISTWDVSSVTDMAYIFSYARSFNSTISEWKVSSVTNLFSAFFHAKSFNSDISKWDVASVSSIGSMVSSLDDAFNYYVLLRSLFSSNQNRTHFLFYVPSSKAVASIMIFLRGKFHQLEI